MEFQGRMPRHARAGMHASWSGGAGLAALVLVCAKTALFTHYGLLSLARGRAGAPVSAADLVAPAPGRGTQGSGAGATGLLAWIEQGVDDSGEELYSLGPDGGGGYFVRRRGARGAAEASAASAAPAVAGAVQMKHRLHRAMMQPAGGSGRARSAPEARNAAPSGGSNQEFGQSGFTLAELQAATRAEKASSSTADAGDAAAVAAAAAAAAAAHHSGSSTTKPAPSTPFTVHALLKHDALGMLPPDNGYVGNVEDGSSEGDDPLPPVGDDMDDEGEGEDEAEGEDEVCVCVCVCVHCGGWQCVASRRVCMDGCTCAYVCEHERAW